MIAGWIVGVMLGLIKNIVMLIVHEEIHFKQIYVALAEWSIWQSFIRCMNGTIVDKVVGIGIGLVSLVSSLVIVCLYSGLLIGSMVLIVRKIKRMSIWRTAIGILCGIFTVMHYHVIGWGLAILLPISVIIFAGMQMDTTKYGFWNDGVFWLFKKKK